MKTFIPGLPRKRNHICVDPQQSFISHINIIHHIKDVNGQQKYIGKTYEPNLKDYPEYTYIIEKFISERIK